MSPIMNQNFEKCLKLVAIVGGAVGVALNWFSLLHDGSFYTMASVFCPIGFMLGVAWFFKPFPHVDIRLSYREQIKQISLFWYAALFLGLGMGLANFYLLTHHF